MAAGLRSGRQDAWTALYDAYFDRVWNLAGRMIGPDPAAVADVVQETFLAAARSGRGFDPQRGALWLWLAGICRNHVMMHFRRRQRDGRIRPGGDLVSGLTEHRARRQGDGGSGPGEALLQAEETTRVRSTLASLPEEYRSVLTARYLEDTPIEALAAMAGCSQGAMRSKLARARRAFRDAFPHRSGMADASEGAIESNP